MGICGRGRPIQAASVVYVESETQPTIDPDDPEDGEPLPLTPGPETPSPDQKACTQDVQFQTVDGTANPYALVNRHVLCVKKQFSESVNVKDKDGIIQKNAGKMTLDTRWSVHGVHNKLEKNGNLFLQYTYEKINTATEAPDLKVIAKIRCIRQGGPEINCDKDTPVVTMAPGAIKGQEDIVIPFSYPAPLDGQSFFSIEVTLFWTTDGTTPVQTEDGSGTTNSGDSGFDAWTLRCDGNQLRKGWKGCVFNNAAAVWTPVPNQDTKWARGHIADVFSSLPDTVVGMFKMAPGQRSKALNFGQHAPLIRADNDTKLNNRADAMKRCIAPAPEDKINAYCTKDMTCDCDEYPPASTEQGAWGKPFDQFSVRRILRSDNQKAGSQMGAMYAKERVLVGDPFWISVGNSSVPPPTTTPGPTPTSPGPGGCTTCEQPPQPWTPPPPPPVEVISTTCEGGAMTVLSPRGELVCPETASISLRSKH